MKAGWAEVPGRALNMNYNSNFSSEQRERERDRTEILIKKKTLLSAIYIIGIIASIMNVSTAQH